MHARPPQARLTRVYDLHSVAVEAVKELHDSDGRVHYLQEPLTRVQVRPLPTPLPSMTFSDLL